MKRRDKVYRTLDKMKNDPVAYMEQFPFPEVIPQYQKDMLRRLAKMKAGDRLILRSR